jgi:hypothetical protein
MTVLSLVAHSRIYAGQFLSSAPFNSLSASNLTASRSTRRTSLRSMPTTLLSCSSKLRTRSEVSSIIADTTTWITSIRINTVRITFLPIRRTTGHGYWQSIFLRKTTRASKVFLPKERKNRIRSGEHPDPAGLFHLGKRAGEETPGWLQIG